MNKIEFVMQTIDALSLTLFKLKTKNFVFNELGLTIYSLQEISFKGYKIVVAIIGESHFLYIDNVFMELLACTEIDDQLPPGVMIDNCFKGKGLKGLNYATTDSDLTYAVNINFSKYCEQDSCLLTDIGKTLITLEEKFPFLYQGKQLPCWTQVKLSIVNNYLQFDSSHSYPPDYIVTSNSKIMLVGK